jgi:UTP--glucose-1-phosphate uridylyltransferase
LGSEASDPFKSVALKGLIEKPLRKDALSNLWMLGRYILLPKVLDLLKWTETGVIADFQLTDAMVELLKTGGLSVFETNASTFDCGDKQGFLGANFAVGIRGPDIKQYSKILISDID